MQGCWAFARTLQAGLDTMLACKPPSESGCIEKGPDPGSRAMASTASKLKADLQHMHTYLHTQQRVVHEETFSAMQAAQACNFARRFEVASGQLSLADASDLSAVLQAGPWSQAQKQQLASCLDKAVEAEGAGRRARRPSQTIKGFAVYLTESDLEALKNPNNHACLKIQVAVDRCFAIGLHLPSEPAAAHIVATLHDLGLLARDGPTQLRYVQEFKTQLRAKIKHAPQSAVHLIQYPASPEELPQPLWAASYANEGPNKQGGNAGLLPGNFPARKSNRACKNKAGSAGEEQQGMSDFMQRMCTTFMEAFAGGMSGASPASCGLNGLQVFQQQKKNKALPAPAPFAAAALADQASSPSQDLQGMGSKAADAGAVLKQDLFDLPAAPLPATNDLAKAEEKQPQGQFGVMADAFQARELSKKHPPSGKPKAKAKGKAKAKPVAKDAGKTPTKKGLPKAKASPKSAAKLPRPPKKGEGTMFWKEGKIHRSDRDGCWRVFVHRSNRVDKKVYWKGDEASAWKRALDMIEAA